MGAQSLSGRSFGRSFGPLRETALRETSLSERANYYICSMQVDDALIEKLSRLSMLRFSTEEKEQIRKDLEQMIGFVDKLKELDTAGVEPLLHMSRRLDVLRDDVAGGMISREDAMLNAPLHDSHYFKVPKVIKK